MQSLHERISLLGVALGLPDEALGQAGLTG
jgi:hypothetical protein